MKNPTGTVNVVVGFDTQIVDQFYRTNPSTGDVLSSKALNELVNDPSLSGSILFGNTGSNLLKFEHSFNIDGENKAPHFKMKFLDMDDAILKKLLSFYIDLDPAAWYSSAGAKDTVLDAYDASAAVIDAGLLTSQEVHAAIRDGTYAGTGVTHHGHRKFSGERYFLYEHHIVPADYREFIAKFKNDTLLRKRLGDHPPLITNVFVMYGMGSDMKYWTGPFYGVITKISINYDSALTQEFEFVVNAVGVEDVGTEQPFVVTENLDLYAWPYKQFEGQIFARRDLRPEQRPPFQGYLPDEWFYTGTRFDPQTSDLTGDGNLNFAEVDFDNVPENFRTKWAPLTTVLTRLLRNYFKKRYDTQNVIILLPDIDWFIQPVLQKILKNFTQRALKWNATKTYTPFEGGSVVGQGAEGFEAWFYNTLLYISGGNPLMDKVVLGKTAAEAGSLGADQHGWIGAINALGQSDTAVAEAWSADLTKHASVWQYSWFLHEAYMILLGLLGFGSGESPNESQNPEAYLEALLKGDTASQTLSDLDRLLGANEMGIFSEQQAGLGLVQQAWKIGPRKVSIHLDSREVDSPEKLLRGLFRRLDALMTGYTLGGEPFFAFENDAKIIKKWMNIDPNIVKGMKVPIMFHNTEEGMEEEAYGKNIALRNESRQTWGMDAASDRERADYINVPTNPFRLDPTEPSVLVIGDEKLVTQFLYGDMHFAYTLATELETADPSFDPMGGGAAAPGEPNPYEVPEYKKTIMRALDALPRLIRGGEVLRHRLFWESIATLHLGPRAMPFLTHSYFEPDPILPDFSFDDSDTISAMYKTLTAQLPEFRAGYPESNILSLEENLDKYLLANIARISHSAAIKDFMRGADTSGGPGTFGGGVKTA